MHWTTVCDFPFADGQVGRATDVSDWHNDAQIVGDIATHVGHVSFQGLDAQLVIPVRDSSLQRFDGLMIEVRIQPTVADRRQNIVEGWMSFALYVEADGQLRATIYDDRTWVATDSQPGAIPFDQWSDVSFEYDGICAGVLRRDGTIIGSNFSMPLGMHQPRENITIGHWPSGDDRYTFSGDIGRVTIRKRDYEDVWQDAVDSMWCNRNLSPRQVIAVKELNQLLSSLDRETVVRLRECAAAQVQAVYPLLRKMRLGNPEVLSAQHKLGDAMLAAWCCGADLAEVKGKMLTLLEGQAGEPGTPQRSDFRDMLAELSRIAEICDWSEPPFDTIRRLFLVTVPELEFAQNWSDYVIATMGRE